MANIVPKPVRIIGLAAALTLLLATGVALLLLQDNGDSRTSADVQMHARIAFAEQATDGRIQIAVLDSGKGDRTTVGNPDFYSAIAWAPTGDVIAALAPKASPGDHARIHLISPASATDVTVDLPFDADPVFPAWSPDGSRLALAGGPIYLLTPEGTVLSETKVPALGEPQSSSIASGGFAWSADSRYFGSVVNGSVIIINAAGDPMARDLKELIPGVVSESSAVLGWSADALVLATLTPDGVQNFKVSPASGALVSSPMDANEPLPTPHAALEPSPEIVEEARRLIPNGEITRVRLSANLDFEVLEVRPAGDTTDVIGSPLAVVVRDPKSGAVSAVPVPTTDTRGGWLYDVVGYTTTP